MRWSWTLGRVAGIRICVHWTFLLLLAWVALVASAHGLGWLDTAEIVGLVLAVFGCVVLHELGHALTARRYGIATRDITIWPIGGLARLERIPEDPRQELLVALAGPAVNVGIALVLWGALWLGDGSLWDALLHRDSGWLASLLWVNLVLAAFNMLPAFPMDGGRVLRALLALGTRYDLATDIAAGIGQGMAVLLGLAGLYWGNNPFLAVVGVFIFFAARAEARSVRARTMTKGVPVRHGMTTRFRVLDAGAPLGIAVEELLASSQPNFPVFQGPELYGMLDRKGLLTALKQAGPAARIQDVVPTDPYAVDPEASLDRVMEQMRQRGSNAAPVMSGGHLVGLLALSTLTDLLTVRAECSARVKDQATATACLAA